MNNASRHTNAQNAGLTPINMQYRAEVASDGSVALIADSPGVGISVAHQLDDSTVTTIRLTAEQFQNLHEQSADPDIALVYQDGQFTIVPIGSVS